MNEGYDKLDTFIDFGQPWKTLTAVRGVRCTKKYAEFSGFGRNVCPNSIVTPISAGLTQSVIASDEHPNFIQFSCVP
jgi:hypothetical protein